MVLNHDLQGVFNIAGELGIVFQPDGRLSPNSVYGANLYKFTVTTLQLLVFETDQSIDHQSIDLPSIRPGKLTGIAIEHLVR